MHSPIDGHTPPPDLGQFDALEVAAGHHADMAEVLRAALDLPNRHGAARADLLSSFLAAKEEGERLGHLAADGSAAHVRTTIARRTASLDRGDIAPKAKCLLAAALAAAARLEARPLLGRCRRELLPEPFRF